MQRLYRCLDELGAEPNLANKMALLSLVFDLIQERKDMLSLKSSATVLRSQLEVQTRRTDRIREAVASFLAGDIGRKRLQRAFDNTDYSWLAGE